MRKSSHQVAMYAMSDALSSFLMCMPVFCLQVIIGTAVFFGVKSQDSWIISMSAGALVALWLLHKEYERVEILNRRLTLPHGVGVQADLSEFLTAMLGAVLTPIFWVVVR